MSLLISKWCGKSLIAAINYTECLFWQVSYQLWFHYQSQISTCFLVEEDERKCFVWVIQSVKLMLPAHVVQKIWLSREMITRQEESIYKFLGYIKNTFWARISSRSNLFQFFNTINFLLFSLQKLRNKTINNKISSKHTGRFALGEETCLRPHFFGNFKTNTESSIITGELWFSTVVWTVNWCCSGSIIVALCYKITHLYIRSMIQ